MAYPGHIGYQMPASEDTQLRRVADLERDVRELGPSIAISFNPVIKSIQDTQATQAAQQVTLASQQATLTAQQAQITAQVAALTALVPVSTATSAVVRTIATLWTDDPIIRPSVTITPTTGRVRIVLGAFIQEALGTYSIAGIVTRDSQILGGKYYTNLFIAGGASGASREWYLSGLTVGVPITVQAEFYGLSSTASEVGSPSITVQNVG
ncbi:hypothetical protein [Cryobacterium sp. MDB2-10]|uniref:hypothetical protein n=1 Tax=Cryobacterium sp. MDB2-10 TaxID=1259177 RepID=UPI00107451FA|nr:hypothetical protein [Cryobacterium sp. MDB2-10]TFC20196.1 hypothetical protein E3O51_05630 [Cryobacterium sp. MDB2-10]